MNKNEAEELKRKIIEDLPKTIAATDHIRLSIDYGLVTSYELENDLIEDGADENGHKKYRPSDYRKGICSYD